MLGIAHSNIVMSCWKWTIYSNSFLALKPAMISDRISPFSPPLEWLDFVDLIFLVAFWKMKTVPASSQKLKTTNM